MYPSIDYVFNIFLNTLIGKLYIDEEPEDLIRKLNLIESEENKDGNEEEKEHDEEETTSTTELLIGGDKTDYGQEATIIDDNGKVFIENLLTGNKFNTGTRWFNLPTVEELFEEFDKIS